MQYDKTFKEEAVRLSNEIGIKNAATQLGISYNTLSTWRQRRKQYGLNAFPGSGYKTLPKDEVLSAAMQSILDESIYNDNYGASRMQLALKQRGLKAGLRRTTRITREHGWLHKPRRKTHGLTHATTEIQEQENLIKQDFSAEKPHQKMLTDIRQIPCVDGKLYISPIMDCFNGEILSLEMRNNMKKELYIDTFTNGKKRYNLSGAILPSDRGSQYSSDDFREELLKAGVTQSLSGVAHCYDNSRRESFFATLKKELLYRIPTYKMRREQVKAIIFR